MRLGRFLLAMWMKLLILLGGADPQEEVEKNAKKKVDRVPSGKRLSDFINQQLRDD